jgi:tetrahydromethanopterin S-methyltransferase subunit G
MKELNADYQKVFKELDTLEVDFENVFSEMMENE